MKRAYTYTILAMLLMAATTFSQDSRRTASTNSSARTERSRSHSTNSTTRYQSSRDRVAVNSNSQSTRSPYNHSRSTTVDRNAHNNQKRQQSVRKTDNYRNEHQQRSVSGRDKTSVNRTNQPHYQNRHQHARHYNHHSSSTRVYRGHHKSTYVYHHAPESRYHRAKYYVYREPVHVQVVWTRDLHRHYIRMYPSVRHWEYRYGYHISSVSAYYADYYIGDVKSVYGKIKEVFYSPESDEYFMYIGAYYPYHDFTIVVPGDIARRFSRRPIAYFTNEYVNTTGLITSFEGKPEIVVKRKFQLDVY